MYRTDLLSMRVDLFTLLWRTRLPRLGQHCESAAWLPCVLWPFAFRGIVGPKHALAESVS
jgi:hypothetical protein